MEPVRAVVCLFSLISVLSFSVVSGMQAFAGTLSESYYSVFDGDYNGDGRVDLIYVPKPVLIGIPSPQGALINVTEKPMVFQQSGDGTYLVVYPADLAHMGSGSLVPSNHDMHYGDFNGDGARDILFQSHENGTQTFIAYGDVGATPKRLTYLGMYGVSTAAASVEIKDLQGDGIDDIAFTQHDGSTRFAYGGTSFIEESDFFHKDSIVPGAEVTPMFSGAFQVDESGAATYSFDLDLPPTPNGMTPSIGISYSSNSGAGSIGIGWSLSAESRIYRCPTTLLVDGYIDGVDFDDNDQFCLDGNRLYLKSGTHGGVGAEYRLSTDNAQKIVIAANPVGEGIAFEVHSPKGAVSRYGVTLDSRLLNGNGYVYTWNLHTNSNVYGDEVVYKYNEPNTNGLHYLDRVEFGNFSVNFSYVEHLPHRVYMAPNASAKTGLILKQITVNDNHRELRKYNFSYESDRFGYQYLAEVSQCTADKCALGTAFDWDQVGDELAAYKQTYTAIQGFGSSDGWRESEHPRYVADINGDGFADILGFASAGVVVALGNSSGQFVSKGVVLNRFGNNQGWSVDNHPRLIADLNGDNIIDIVGFSNTGVEAALGNGDGTFRSVSTGLTNFSYNGGWRTDNHPRFVEDINQDGYADIVGFANGAINVALGRGDGTFISVGGGLQAFCADQGWQVSKHPRMLADINGDGNLDIIGFATNNVAVALGQGDGRFISVSTGLTQFTYGSSWRVENHPRFVDDINGDGYADIVGFSSSKVVVALGKGNGTFEALSGGVDGFGYNQGWRVGNHPRMLADINGDSILDIVGFSNSGMHVSRGLGDGTFASSEKLISGYGYDAGWRVDEHPRMFSDVNGDGINDVVGFSSSGAVVALGNWRLGKITSIHEPVNSTLRISYGNLTTTSSYIEDSSPNLPDVINIRPPFSVVTSIETDNGIGGVQKNNYQYYGLKQHIKGHGSLGFSKQEAIDTTTGIRTITEYSQDFANHKVGMVTRTETRYVKDGHNKKLNETINTNDVQEIAYGNLFVRMPYLKYQEIKSWDFVTGQLVGMVAAEFSYDELGNLLENTTTTTDPVTGEVFTSVKSTQYYPVQDTPYFAGLVERIDSSSSVPGTPESGPLTAARSTYFEYNQLGAPIKQVVEPGHAKALTTEFEYNAAGQVTFTRVSAAGLPTKVSETRYYDAGPQKGLEYQQINALGHTTTFYYENADYPWLRTRTVDPNGRISKTYYDSWGRAPTVEAADGTTITQQTFWCDENCEEGEAYYGKATASVGKPSYVFFDKEGREVRKSAYGFDGTNEGRLVHIRTEYNAIGKIARHSEPHFDGDIPQWNQTWYDDLGRPQIAYDSSGNPMTYIHLGRQVMSTNALGQSKTVETNAQGQTVRVTDAIGKDIEYAYGPFGELLYTRDSDGVVTRAQYDLFGNKIAMQDPDKGNWTYEYDAYGQLLRQTDARGWVTYHEYDILGRMTKRVDRYGTSSAETSTWQYDLANLGSTGRKALGMLNRSAKGAFIEVYQFDNLGRPTVTSTTIDGVVWNSSTTYDAYSRPLTTSYPGGGLVIKSEYHPTLGILQRIKNNSTNAEYWELQETNARGQASLIQLGNLMVTSNTFNEQTGYLESVTTYVPGQATNLQEMSFHFDAIGNLQVREEYQRVNGVNQLVTETLSYDNLNRLVESHVVSPLLSYYNTLAYQDNGNIATKSEVGAYTYGGTCNGVKAGPHAVTRIVGQKNATYCYDQNGNMLSGDSRTIIYTPQDVPKKITKGSNSVEFFYGPNQERYKRIDVEGGVTTTTISIGGYERIKSGSDTTYKYYVGGFAVVSKKNSEALKTQYLLKDHQGSVVAAVDSLGTVIERMSFDAWGKRRTVTWEGMADTSLFAYKSAVTNRGYTGHEHVDSMGLIHMNGRIYDPVIGRFLSADPFVQDATNSQSLNRYSYVMNNPLSMTDPSGFFWKKIKKAFKKVVKAVVKAVKLVVRAMTVVALGPAYAAYKLHHAMWDATKKALQNKYIAAVAQIVGCYVAAPLCPVIAGMITAVAAYGATGDWNSALRAGVTAAASTAVSMGMSGAIGNVDNLVGNTMLHGASGAVMAKAQGGSARSGFISGSVGALASNVMAGAGGKPEGFGGRPGRTAISAIAGGLGAKWSGGDAAYGAFNAAVGHLFNHEDALGMHSAQKDDGGLVGKMTRFFKNTAEENQVISELFFAEDSPLTVEGLLKNGNYKFGVDQTGDAYAKYSVSSGMYSVSGNIDKDGNLFGVSVSYGASVKLTSVELGVKVDLMKIVPYTARQFYDFAATNSGLTGNAYRHLQNRESVIDSASGY